MGDFYSFVARDEVLDLFRRLVQTDTSNPPGQEETAAHLLHSVLKDSGLELVLDRFAPLRANLTAIWKRKGTSAALLLSGHLDTVPADPTTWKFPPHAATVEEGWLHGRGSVDMKGAVAAMAMVCLALARSGCRLAGDVIFAATAGEEVDSAGAHRLLAQGLPPIRSIIVGEPTCLHVATAHKGALWLQIETHGKAAHGSMPEQGQNAILAMQKVIAELSVFQLVSSSHPLLGSGSQNIGTIQGGVKPNIVPDRCTLTVDIRTLPGESHESIVELLKKKLHPASVRVLNSMTAVDTPVEHPFIQSALRLAQHLHGEPSSPRGMSYYTDASVLYPALQCPVLIFGPGDERLAHQANETVDLNEVLKAAAFYFDLVQEVLNE